MSTKLFKNIGFLTFSQTANYIFPLITVPYVTRIVGPDNYGLIEFGTVAMLYFSAIVMFGFNVSVTRKIAENPRDMNKVSFLFSTALYTRVFLLCGSLILFALCFLVIPKFSEQSTLMLFAFPIVIGWALYPSFLFQGLQKLQVVAVANFLIKGLAAALIIVFLTKPEDFYIVLGINAVAQVIVGLFTLIYALKSVRGLTLFYPGVRALKAIIVNGWNLFLAHFFTRIYSFGSIIFLGLMLNEKDLGLFAAGMKLIIVAQSFLFLPLFGALFPYLTNLYKQNKLQYIKEYKRAMYIMLVVTFISSATIFIFPSFFVNLVFGKEYLEAVPYLLIMTPILILSTFHQFSMQQGLIILKKDKANLYVIVGAGVLSILLNLVFIPISGIAGAAWVKLAIDVFLAIAGWLQFRKHWTLSNDG